MPNSNYSIKEAAKSISSGDVVWVGSMKEISVEFLDALAERSSELRNVTIVGYDFISDHEIMYDSKYSASFKVINYSDMPYKTARRVMANTERRELPDGNLCREIAKPLGVNVIAVKTCPADGRGLISLSAYGKYATCDMLRFNGIEKTIAIVDGAMQPAVRHALEREMRLTISQRYFKVIATSNIGSKEAAA